MKCSILAHFEDTMTSPHVPHSPLLSLLRARTETAEIHVFLLCWASAALNYLFVLYLRYLDYVFRCFPVRWQEAKAVTERSTPRQTGPP